MKLSEAKRNYKRCKSLEGKRNAFNKAMLNLSHSDQQSFIAWQKQF